MAGKKDISTDGSALVRDIRKLIDEARSTIASTVNAALTTLYWQVLRKSFLAYPVKCKAFLTRGCGEHYNQGSVLWHLTIFRNSFTLWIKMVNT